jgi:hypothetical protein
MDRPTTGLDGERSVVARRGAEGLACSVLLICLGACRSTSGGPLVDTSEDVPTGRVTLVGTEFLTTTIEFGGRPEPLEARVLRADPGATVLSLTRGVEEHLTRVPNGWEQSWRFERPMPGDIVVRVGVEGLFLGEDHTGISFGTGATRVHYSHATLVDADGDRTEVRAR